MEPISLSENQDGIGEFLASLFTLLQEGFYVCMVLLVLTGVEMLVERLHCRQEVKDYVVNVHELSVLSVFTLLGLKSVVRIAVKYWRQLCKSLKKES